MRSLAVVLLVALLSGCRSAQSESRLAADRTYAAVLQTSDGAEVTLWRWPASELSARKVLIIPELGFDHRLVTPLGARLRRAGFDVATFDGRHLGKVQGTREGLAGWLVDAGRATAAHGPKPIVVALGVGGSVAWELASLDALAGIVAVNVPQRFELDNAALRQAMSELMFDPKGWLDSKYGAVLLTGTRQPSSTVLAELSRLVVPVPGAMRAEVAALYTRAHEAKLPAGLPLSVILSSKGNVVPTEHALLRSTPSLVHSRRLGRMETFRRDYGHLDWLVDEDALDEVAPVIVSALEAMP